MGMPGSPLPSRPIQSTTTPQAVLLGTTANGSPLSAVPPSKIFLSLVSMAAILSTHRSDTITNRKALSALAAFAALTQIDLIDESGLDSLW